MINDAGSARKLMAVEWLKAELLSEEGDLFRALINGPEDRVIDALSGILITTYTLGLRLGISPPRLEDRAIQRLNRSLTEDHELEEWFGDLSGLVRYLSQRDG
ncbi:MAG: MazG-like family protein [Firmicutes bacterium]|nr:MazG-like family protein [Bacillota bacterium]